jgi:ABC-type oligopeptide transport system ATPase subunit
MRNLGEINDYVYGQSILKGKVITEPEYKQQELEEYENNPFIECLPPLFETDDVIERFTFYPVITEEDRYKKANVRYHMIKRLKNFIQPLETHFSIEQDLSTMILRGYLARNPNSKEFLQRLQLINNVKNEKATSQLDSLDQISESIRSTADSLSIIGISGIGKTTAIERLLLMYPQVVHHTEYRNRPLTRAQIVWLKIDCSFDGSLKTLCKLFFKAIDDVLGTTRYFQKFGNNRNSTATMMIHMTYLASVYAIGVLIIYEMQHLMIKAKHSPDEMLNFFVTLVNTIGVPIVSIGTFKALQVLKKDFRQARRSGSEGNYIWDRMKKNDEWDFFLDTMWDFQWLKQKTALNEELNTVMYEESQGITAIAVNLYILAQGRALNTETEILNVALIRKTAREDLHMIQPMIKALRNNDLARISEFEDISINLESLLGNTREQLDLRGKVSELAKQQETIRNRKRSNIAENLLIEVTEMGIFKELKEAEIEKVIYLLVDKLGISEEYAVIKQALVKELLDKDQEKAQKRQMNEQRKKNSKTLVDDDLRKLYLQAKRQKKHVYEIFGEKGCIKNPVMEFLKVE